MTLSTWLSYITRFAPSLDTRTFHTLTEKLMFGKEPNASRKYVDLILNASSKYANWDPGVPVEVGDYGSINKDTGLFDYEGNIFSEAFRNLLNFSGDPAHQTEPENKYVIQSNIETGAAVELGPTASLNGILEASVKGEWKFRTKNRGAVLFLAGHKSSYMNHAIPFKDVIQIPELHDKSLVQATVKCPAYASYLSSTASDSISLALVASTPLPVAPVVSAGGELSWKWVTTIGSGIYRDGVHSRDDFVPLYVLKDVKPPSNKRDDAKRDSTEGLDDTPPPWATLDEDGTEDAPYDGPQDSDTEEDD